MTLKNRLMTLVRAVHAFMSPARRFMAIVATGLFVCVLIVGNGQRPLQDSEPTRQPGGAIATSPPEPTPLMSEIPARQVSANHAWPGEKLIALTFDDGPTAKGTDRILRVLKKNNVRATFFVIGRHVDAYPEVVKRTYGAGMLIGAHTHNHKVLTKLTPYEMFGEVNHCVKAVRDACGYKPTLLRPPGGAINDTVLRSLSMPMILWSVDTRDWITRNSKDIYRHLIRDARDGAIVLMHDTVPATARALEKAIPKLKQMGYRFVTVDELYMTRSTPLVAGAVHYSCPPDRS